MTFEIPNNHPRAESLREREKLISGFEKGAVARAGLIAHGRGEAFDYLLGEKTNVAALQAIKAASAAMLLAQRPIISVNGNSIALAAKELVTLSKMVGAKIEVNLFYRTNKRERIIEDMLKKVGATKILGVGKNASAKIEELGSERRRVDPRGILIADLVLVPLEDGDRTEALVEMGKTVIAIDLNPLSRTAQKSTITIVDNLVRALPLLLQAVLKLKNKSRAVLENILRQFDNKENLTQCLDVIKQNLSKTVDTVMV